MPHTSEHRRQHYSRSPLQEKRRRSKSPPLQEKRRRSKSPRQKHRSRSHDKRTRSRSREKYKSRSRDQQATLRRPERNDSENKECRSKYDRHEKQDAKSPRSPKQRPWDRDKKRHWKDPEGGRKFEWGKAPLNDDVKSENATDKPKELPNFDVTGKLAEDTNKFKGVVIKYNEPPEACKPKVRWRLYPFKNNESLPTLYIHRQSAYLIGKDRRVADLPIDHPSCSKQHAVLQYRQVGVKSGDGQRTGVRQVKPYIIDLESSNGTFLNNVKIEPRRYYELREKDVLKFGYSTREYVVLHEGSLGVGQDDESDGAQSTPDIDRPIKQEVESD